jgi:Xaa-Pro dipeptidase
VSTTFTVGPNASSADLASSEAFEARLASEYGAHLAIWDQRLEGALAATGFDGAVVFAGDEEPIFRDDQSYPFRVEPYFNIWLPLTEATGSFLRLVPGQRPMLVYKQADDYWFEPPSDPEGYWTRHFDIRIVRSDAEARKLSISGPRWVAIGSAAARNVRRASKTTPAAINDPKFLTHLDYSRAQKTAYELLNMRGAQARAVDGHIGVANAFGSGVSELELHQVYLACSRQRETRLPYGSIVALNEHAATLHYQHLRAQPPSPIRSLLIDAGASCNGYAADITRTYSSSPGDDFSALIASMDALQQRICSEVRPGVEFLALHGLAQHLIAGVLREHGIVKCSADEAVTNGIARAFMPHGLGHLLGLQVHDVGGWLIDGTGKQRPPPTTDPFLRLTRTLKAGFVVTIEPGVYFIPSLLRALLAKHEDKLNRARIERFLPFGGIRVEDNVEVTRDGHRNLTREAFAAAQGRRERD